MAKLFKCIDEKTPVVASAFGVVCLKKNYEEHRYKLVLTA